jgi:hypothetical protein
MIQHHLADINKKTEFCITKSKEGIVTDIPRNFTYK